MRIEATTTSPGAARARAALTVITLLWAGMVLGISFLESPVKFTAPTLTLPVGLDVGRHVFQAFNKVEIAWALAGLWLAWAGRPGRRIALPIAAAVLFLVIQTFFLLPPLDRRTNRIIAGQRPPAAPYHLLYIALETGKLLALAGAGIGLAARRR